MLKPVITLAFALFASAATPVFADNIIRMRAPIAGVAHDVSPSFTLATSSIPDAKLQRAFSFDFTNLVSWKNLKDGVTPSISWRTSALPDGLSFNSGQLSGKPTKKGSYPITVHAISGNEQQQEYSLLVKSPYEAKSCDPYWSSVKYYIDGSSTASPESKAALTVSDVTGLSVDSDSPVDTGKSFRFNGSTRLAFSDNAALNLGASDFTIEFFLKMDNFADVALLGKGGGSNIAWYSYFFRAWPSGALSFMASTDNTGYQIGSNSASTGFGAYTPGVWTQIAVTRQGSTFRAFQDGILKATYTSSASLYPNTGRGLQVGHNRGNNFVSGPVYTPLTGNIQGIRVSNIARYTANYTPTGIAGGACQ